MATQKDSKPSAKRPSEPASDGAAPQLPHDRDEATHDDEARSGERRRPIAQAHDDVQAGIQDTERIGVPTVVPSSVSKKR